MFSLDDEYRAHSSWAFKLLQENLVENKTKSPSKELQNAHQLSKLRKIFCAYNQIMNIKNKNYSGPLQKQIGDILYTKHGDVKYFYNLLSHLSILEGLTTVTDRQTEQAQSRNQEKEIESLGERTFVVLWDNFCKFHSVIDPVYGNSQTMANDMLNVSLLGLPAPKKCSSFLGECCECEWSKDIPVVSINLNELNLSHNEETALQTFKKNLIQEGQKEVFELSDEIMKITSLNECNFDKEITEDYNQDEHTFDKNSEDSDQPSPTSTDQQSSPSDSGNPLKVKVELSGKMKGRAELRKICMEVDVTEGSSDSVTDRLTLRSVKGKDTDWSVAKSIMLDVTEMCKVKNDKSLRMFAGGDQKTMWLALKMIKQWPNELDHFYVTLPDMHFRKSMLHAILTKYAPVGLRHLAAIAGYKAEEQWDFLVSLKSIPKAFAFVERVMHTLILAMLYEFWKTVDTEQKEDLLLEIEDGGKNDKKIFINLFQKFVRTGKDDLVWQKNFELLDHLENLFGHYQGERTKHFDLRMASMKAFIPFAMVANCTAYGPLLIELVLHQASFQPRYKETLKENFSQRIGEGSQNGTDDRTITTGQAFVGFDAIAEDTNLRAGHFRHKRQSAEQAIQQSDNIDIMWTELKSLKENLGIKEKPSKRFFKDDRVTKSRLLTAMINCGSFKVVSGRELVNEFSTQQDTFSKIILEKHWHPASVELIRRYARNSKPEICNTQSIDQFGETELVNSPEAKELLKRVKGGKSTVINVKAVKSHSQDQGKRTIQALNRKVKSYTEELLWKASPFKPCAAIRYHDGSKPYPAKAKFREALVKNLQKKDPCSKSENKDSSVDGEQMNVDEQHNSTEDEQADECHTTELQDCKSIAYQEKVQANDWKVSQLQINQDQADPTHIRQAQVHQSLSILPIPDHSQSHQPKENQEVSEKIAKNIREGSILGNNPTACLNDAQLGNLFHILKETQGSNHDLRIMYPMPEQVFHKRLTGETPSKSLQKSIQEEVHACIVPFSDGEHWRVVIAHGETKMVYHFDSLGNEIKFETKELLQKCFPGEWKIHDFCKCYQADSYQCGVWCYVVVERFLKYLNLEELTTFSIEEFGEVHELRNTQDRRNDAFIKVQRAQLQKVLEEACISNELRFCLPLDKKSKDIEKTISRYSQDEDEDLMVIFSKDGKDQGSNFLHSTFPHHISFSVTTVDAQHTLWDTPPASNGKDYISFLFKRHWSYYFNVVKSNIIYWSYDLKSAVDSMVSKTQEQQRRGKGEKQQMDEFCADRLMGTKEIITNNHVISDWKFVQHNRRARNLVANYVGGNSDNCPIPNGKALVINSEFMKDEDGFVCPQQFKKDTKTSQTIRTALNEEKNRFAEGEGSAIAFITKHHKLDNCLIVSNDTDSLIFGILGSMQRETKNGKFISEWWLQINYQQKSKICGVLNGKTSEFWDLNSLIYSIKAKAAELYGLRNSVLGIPIIYLAGGTDITDKWFGLTHHAFLSTWFQQSEFIGDLVKESKDGISLDRDAYRRLLHSTWCRSSVKSPSEITYESCRNSSMMKKNIRSHLPPEEEISLVSSRIDGA